MEVRKEPEELNIDHRFTTNGHFFTLSSARYLACLPRFQALLRLVSSNGSLWIIKALLFLRWLRKSKGCRLIPHGSLCALPKQASRGTLKTCLRTLVAGAVGMPDYPSSGKSCAHTGCLGHGAAPVR